MEMRNRRNFLTMATTISVGLSGCLDSLEDEGDDGNDEGGIASKCLVCEDSENSENSDVGNWDQNVRLDSSISGLELDFHGATSMASGTLEGTIEVRGDLEYHGDRILLIEQIDLLFMMGDSAYVDDPTIEFDPNIALGEGIGCDSTTSYGFNFDVVVSGIQDATDLIFHVSEDHASLVNTC